MTSKRVIAVGGEASFRPQVARALLVSPDTITWLPSLEDAQRSIENTVNRISLLVLGPTVSEEQAMLVAERLGRESPATAVVLVRDGSVDGAFPRLVRSGIRDVVDLSTGDGELDEALRRALEWSTGVRSSLFDTGQEEHRGAVVSVFSTKGGTGKTFLSCNLAAALASTIGAEVALLDLDHDFGDVFAYFNAEPRRPLHDLLDLQEGAERQAVVPMGTPLEGGVVGFGSPPDPQADPIPAAAMGTVLRSLQEAFPFVVVDASAEYSDHVLTAFDLSDVVCLVTSLDVIGVRHLSLAMQTLERLGVARDRFRVILNRADSGVHLTAAEIERTLGIGVDAHIPSSPLVPRSINHGRLVWLEAPRSDVARSIGALAAALCRQLKPEIAVASGQRRSLLRRG